MNIPNIKPLQLVLLVICSAAVGVVYWARTTAEGAKAEKQHEETTAPINQETSPASDGTISDQDSNRASATATSSGIAPASPHPQAGMTNDTTDTAPARSLPGYVPLKDSPVARKWRQSEGVTVEDIETAQQRMRNRGFPEARLDDPGLVRQFLPRRNIVAVNVTDISISERAVSGSPVPFRISGVYPDASYRFSHFDMIRDGEVIRIRPIGESSGDVTPGMEIPVSFDGALDPLPPGEYIVEFPEAGPTGTRRLVIE